MIQNNIHKHIIAKIYVLVLFLSCFVFLERVVTSKHMTPTSVGELYHNKSYYSLGTIYDRHNNIIVTGTNDQKITWKKSKNAFENLIGTNMSAKYFSKSTIIGQCPWLIGQGDRLNISNLLHPSKKNSSGNVQLTIDSDLQKYIYNYMTNNHNFAGDSYVVVSNYQTGEVLGTYGNIFRDSLSAGSTLKPIIAACALTIDPSLKNYTYNCTKNTHDFSIGNKKYMHIKCAGNAYHGQRMTMESAIAHSCNGYFISLLEKINESKLKNKFLTKMKQLGFDSSKHYEGFNYADASLVGKKDTKNPVNYLLAAIGQANCKISPFQLNLLTSALLNKGNLSSPLIYTKKQDTPVSSWDTTTSDKKVIFDSKIAVSISNMMKQTCLSGTGTAFYLKNLAAKTGTAETAKNSLILWTTGGLLDQQHPYAITVCLNDRSKDNHSSEAGLIARDILNYYKQHTSKTNTERRN